MSNETCNPSYRPSFYNLVIQTSDVSLYDGPNLSCIPVAPGATLNQVLASIDSVICGLVSPTIPTAANISYGGTTSFGCFTLTGTNVQAVIEELGTQICTVNTSLTSLTLNDLTLGASFTGSCVGSYTSGSNPLTLLQDIVDKICAVSVSVDTIYSDYTPKLTISDLMNGNDIVVSGGGSGPVGLFTTINAAVYIVDGARFSKGVVPNLALTATSDNYIDYNSGTDSYTVSAVTISDPAPAIASGAIRIWKHTTNGVTVTASVDYRVASYINSTLLMRDSVTATQIATGAVTGVKMETIGAGATVGEANFINLTYDTKGRVTAYTYNIDLTGLAASDVLQWNGATWVPAAINSIGGNGTNGRLARFTAASTIASSLIRDDGTTQSVNAAVAGNIQLNLATTLTYGYYVANTGTNATQYGYYSTVSGATSVNVGGYFQANGALAGLAVAGSYIGIIGTAVTLNAREAYGGRFGVDGDAASSGDCVALYAYAQNAGSGKAIGLLVEAGQAIFGGTSPDASAALQIDSITQGFLPPRMTTAERDAIASPAYGLIIYNLTTSKLDLYTGAWEVITSA